MSWRKKRLSYRDYKPTIPPQVTYGLADKGKDLAQVLMLIDKVAQIMAEGFFLKFVLFI